MEFTPINTKEEFEARVAEVYGDVADLQGQIQTLTGERDTHATTITQLQAEINGYKTADLKRRIAEEKGIPLEMAARLSGDDEAAMRADADSMATVLRAYKGTAPLFDPANKHPDPQKANLENTLKELRGE